MRVVIAAGFAAAFAGCTVGSRFTAEKPDEGAPEKREETTEAAAPGPVIVTLQSQKGRVTVYASEVGPLFTIAKKDGTVEAEGLSYVELEDRYPDYYRALRNSIAEDGRMYAGYDRAIDGESIKFRTLDASR